MPCIFQQTNTKNISFKKQSKSGGYLSMTIELIEYKCPVCSHLIGEEEYLNVKTEFNKIIQEKVEEHDDKTRGIYEEKLYKKDLELQKQEEKHKDEIEAKVHEQVQLQLDTKLLKQKDEYEHKLAQKETEKNEIKLQADNNIDKKIAEALEKQDEKFRQQKFQDQLKWERIQKRNEELQKTLDNIPSEFKGQAGEIMLFEELHKAFPQDDLIPQTNGVEMPDLVQTIVQENGDRICTPILWDMKTGETVPPKDIEKVKRYKEKYNTDYCIVVTEKCITTKDSKIYRTGLIGKREGVLFVHPKIVVGVAELTRSFLIEKTKLIKNNNGKVSKQTKLYDYITSDARFRKMQEKMLKKIKLDEIQRLEEAYMIKLWKEAKKLRQDWYDLDREDQENINEIIQEEGKNDQEIDGDQTRKDTEEED